jgi:hypothetical protein
MVDGSNGTHEKNGVGAALVGTFGIIALGLYLVGGALFTAYSLVALWPPQPGPAASQSGAPAPKPSGAPGAGQPPSGTGATPTTPAAPKAASNEPPTGAASNQDAGRSSGTSPSTPTTNPANAGRSTSPSGSTGGTGSSGSTGATGSPASEPQTGAGVEAASYLGYEIHGMQRITILIVLFSGALGGLVHALRSFFWYVGNRELKWSWVPMYLLLPFTGGLLGLVFYIVLVAGLFAGAPGSDGKLAGFAAIAALVGMFSTPAALKLQEIFETIFAKRQEGKDAVKTAESAAPVVKKVTVTAVPGGAGQTLSVEGTDFQAPLTVKVANSAGATTPVTPKNVTPTKFEADVTLAAGSWTITVAGKDGKTSPPFPPFTV